MQCPAAFDHLTDTHCSNTLQREPLVDICRILLDGRTLPDGPVKITKRLSKPKAREMLKWLSEGGQARWKEVCVANLYPFVHSITHNSQGQAQQRAKPQGTS